MSAIRRRRGLAAIEASPAALLEALEASVLPDA